MELSKHQINAHLLEILGIDGYSPVGTSPGAFYFVKKIQNGTEQIVIPYRKSLGAYFLAPYIVGWKTFDSVENILKPIYKKNKFEELNITLNRDSRREKIIQEVKIDSHEKLDSLKNVINSLLWDDILPFFRTYSTLSDIYMYINSHSLLEINKIVFSPPHIRVLIIKRLMNDAYWEEYYFETKNSYEVEATKGFELTFAPLLHILDEVYGYLKQL